MEHTFCPEEFARDVESFASDDDDLLAVQQLLRHSTGQATQEMSLAIDDDLNLTPSVITLPDGCCPCGSGLVEGLTYDRIEARHPGMLVRWSGGLIWGSYCLRSRRPYCSKQIDDREVVAESAIGVCVLSAKAR